MYASRAYVCIINFAAAGDAHTFALKTGEGSEIRYYLIERLIYGEYKFKVDSSIARTNVLFYIISCPLSSYLFWTFDKERLSNSLS